MNLSPFARSCRRPIVVLLGAAGLLALSPAAARAQAIMLANPHWNITLTDYGYSDFLLDNTPGFEGREYLSGEWGAAVAYHVAGDPAVSPQWLEPQFLYPDWPTGSPFHVVTGFAATPALNADGLPIAETVIANNDLEITLRYEMLDTVVGVPMGTTPASSGGVAEAITSSRYVMKQTATLRNVSGASISNLQFFQFLHGLQSQRGVYDNRAHAGTLGQFRYDTTLAGVDAWAAGPGSSSAGLEDYIGFHADRAPDAYEIGHYGIEGNGIDDHWSRKPTDGVHLSVENNWQTPPFSTRQGTDSFAPAQRWLAGAQRWSLGTPPTPGAPLVLAAGQSVSLDLLLSVRTGTRVTATVVSGGCNGGSGVPGGVDYEFADVTADGSCFGEYTQADDEELAVRVAAGEFEPLDFPVPAKPAQIWQVHFNGAFSGSAHLGVGYDPLILPGGFDENALCLYQFNGVDWVKLAGTVNPALNTISVDTPILGPLALGAGAIETYTVSVGLASAEVGSEVMTPDPLAGTVTGAGSYVQGTSVSLVATASPGYVFKNWTDDLDVEVSTSPGYTFTLTGARSLMANFRHVGLGNQVITTSSLPVQGGATGGDGAYGLGTSATVNATAAGGYKFSKWLDESGTVVSTANPYTFTVTGDAALVAKFKPVYTLTLTVEGPEGSGQLEGDPTYEPGDLVKLKAQAEGANSFVNWTTPAGTPISTDPNFQFTMTGNRELVGHFAPGLRIDTSSIPPHAGTTSGGGVHDVDGEGRATVTLVADPEPGYVFLNWTEAGSELSTSATYLFETKKTLAIVANFGLPQEIAVEEPEGNGLTDGVSVVDFGSAAATRTFTIRNHGDVDLTGLLVSRDGPAAGDFTVDTTLMATTLAQGEFTTFTVSFSPGAAAQRTATLHIVSNDADESPFDVLLVGNNTAPLAADPTVTRAQGMSVKISRADLLAQCSDADSDALTLDSVAPSTQGVTPVVTATHIVYVPQNDLDDQLDYTISDGYGGTAVGSITIQVTSLGGRVQEIDTGGGGVTVRFHGIPGFRYQIERAENAAFTVGTQVVDTFVAPHGPYVFTDLAPPSPMGYYRLKYAPAL